MRLLDRKWSDLALGYQAILSFQTRLETEFGRAVDVGLKQFYRRQLTTWQKKRRVFFALVALLPLTLVALCVTSYIYREVFCVLAWWLLTAIVAFITMAVAGWSFIREMVAGRPKPMRGHIAVRLVDLWWPGLTRPIVPSLDRQLRHNQDFLTRLTEALPESFLASNSLFPVPPDSRVSGLFLVGPSGIWLFSLVPWKGKITKQDGLWKHHRGNRAEPFPAPAPDDLWVLWQAEIVQTIQQHLPHLSHLAENVQGGVVFTHPRIHLAQSAVQGNTAAYGPASAWLDLLQKGTDDSLNTLPVQLELLDALNNAASQRFANPEGYASCRAEAERIYNSVSEQLRSRVASMVK